MKKRKGLTANTFATEMVRGSQERDPFFISTKVGRRVLKLSFPNYGIICWYRDFGDYQTRGGSTEAIAEFLHYHGGLTMTPERFVACEDYVTNHVTRELAELFAGIINARALQGMFDAFDPIGAMEVMVSAQHEAQQVLKAAGFTIGESPQYPEFEDIESLIALMDFILKHPILAEMYLAQAKHYAQHSSFVDYEWMGKTVHQVLPAGALIADIGAGDCDNIVKVASIVDIHRFVAIERQPLGKLFPNGNKPVNLAVIQADFADDFDLEPCDALFFAAVWGHQTLPKAKLVAAKALRLLKEGGYAFSGPQLSGGFGGWANISVHRKQGERMVPVTDNKFGT